MDEEAERIKKEKMEKMLNRNIRTELEVNDDNFEERVAKQSESTPVVVDFWAEWCMPCKMLSPILEKFAKEYNGKFILAKADLGENQNTAMKYQIRSIPAVKLFKNGEVVDEFVGAIPQDMIKKWLDKNLNGND